MYHHLSHKEIIRVLGRGTSLLVEKWIAVGTFRAKDKGTVGSQVVRDWRFAEKARTP
jgi:hypothetical protein